MSEFNKFKFLAFFVHHFSLLRRIFSEGIYPFKKAGKGGKRTLARKETLLPPEEFVRRAVLRLRKGQAKSIHSVFSGFNAAWRQYYQSDPVEGVKALEKKGVCVTHPTRGGVRIYLAEDAPSRKATPEEVVGIILG